MQADRRPLKTRSRTWAIKAAASVAKLGFSPNQISVASVLFAAIGGVLLLYNPNVPNLIICAIAIQLRLLCNMLDGMVAVELGKKSPVGHLYNEVPDRIADTILIASLGCAIHMPWLGWFGAVAAITTAYIRVLGGSLGFPQDFRGPMAKPHRMAVLTAACIIGAIEIAYSGTQWALVIAAYVIAVGSCLTCITRTVAIASELQSRGTS